METNNTNATSIAERVIERFEEATSNDSCTIDETTAAELIAMIGDKETFRSCLGAFRDKADAYKETVDLREALTKESQSEKKLWKARLDSFLNGFLGSALTHFGEKSIKDSAGVRVSSQTRTSLVVDDERLIDMWRPMITSLEQMLPPFLKISVSVDKKALTDYCATQEDLMAKRSDIITSVAKTSTTIK